MAVRHDPDPGPIPKRDTPEHERLEAQRTGEADWRAWGPYLSERQWGTVREDYSGDGNAWDYFDHEMARSRAYRWGEDGIGGVSDQDQRLCMAVALWNGVDPILKERLFGLTNPQGNHGEDVKELYYYLDAVPTHAYLKMLYKYPQGAFPYDRLIEENQNRGVDRREFELLDTGVFDDGRYFDVQIEYAKVGPDDLLLRVTAYNRGPEAATLHILPHVWFRNTWSWDHDTTKPTLAATEQGTVQIDHPDPDVGRYMAWFDGRPRLLFCENETNPQIFSGDDGGDGHTSGYFKDAIHDAVVHGDMSAVNPKHVGTKCAAQYHHEVPAGGSCMVRVRMSSQPVEAPLDGFDAMVELRRQEADLFYADLQRGIRSDDARHVQRQALAGADLVQAVLPHRHPSVA